MKSSSSYLFADQKPPQVAEMSRLELQPGQRLAWQPPRVCVVLRGVVCERTAQRQTVARHHELAVFGEYDAARARLKQLASEQRHG